MSLSPLVYGRTNQDRDKIHQRRDSPPPDGERHVQRRKRPLETYNVELGPCQKIRFDDKPCEAKN